MRPTATRDRSLPTTVARGLAFALTAALAASAAGCGGDRAPYAGAVYPVKGRVLLPGGKPLSGGKVQFLPTKEAGMPATGEIDADGNFSLKSADNRDGAAPGDYKVRVVPGEKYVSKKLGRVDPRSLPFAPKYMDEDGETGLTATVKDAPTDLPPFQLTDARSEAPVSRKVAD